MLPVLLILPLLGFSVIDQTVDHVHFLYFLCAYVPLLLFLGRWVKQNPPHPNHVLSILWGLLLVRLTISTVFSISVPNSVIGLVYSVSAFSFFLIGSSIPSDRLRTLVYLVAGSATVLSLVSLAMTFHIIPAPSGSVNLLVRTFGHNRLSEYLALTSPVLVILLLSVGFRLLLVGSAAIVFATFFLTGGRAAYTSLLAALGYLYWTVKDPLVKKVCNAFGIGVTSVLLVLLVLPVVSRLAPGSTLLDRVNQNQNFRVLLMKPLINEARLSYWGQAINAFLVRPVGWGIGTSRFVLPRYRYDASSAVSSYPHNHFIQMFVETGLSGGILFLALILYSLFAAHAASRNGDQLLVVGATAGLIASSVNAVLDFNWQFPSIFLLYCFLMGFTTSARGPTQAGTVVQSHRWSRVLIPMLTIVTAYGVVSLLLLNRTNFMASRWSKGGKEAFMFVSPVVQRLHPLIQEQYFELGKRMLSIEGFSDYVDSNYPLYRYNNLMLSRVLDWRKYFGTTGEVQNTALDMINNDPFNNAAISEYLRIMVLQENASKQNE